MDFEIASWYLLGEPNLFGAGSLGTASFFVQHGLPNAEGFDPRAFDGTVMEKQLAVFPVNESESLFREHFLDRPLRHTTTP
jgi:hypothetical protein